MEKIILIFLIAIILSVDDDDVYYLPKYGSLEKKGNSIIYLDADKFGNNSIIHIHFKSSSNSDSLLYYDFTDVKPTSTSVTTREIKYTFYTYSVDEDDTDNKEYNYYYDIKKDVSKKYLFFISPFGMVENTFINWALFIVIFVCLVSGLAAIFLVCLFIYLSVCEKENKQETINNNETQMTTKESQKNETDCNNTPEGENKNNETTNKETPLMPSEQFK